ncbi:MAG: hypothetical protein AAGA77_09140 [Bacteroidota bacterium]
MRSVSRCFVIVVFVCFFGQVNAQIGFRAKYNMNSFPAWDNRIEENRGEEFDDIFQSGVELGIDYQFRLKNVRIEFLSEFAIGLKMEPEVIHGFDLEFSYLAFMLHSHIYLFDLKRTNASQSKTISAFKKNFFISLSTGILDNRKLSHYSVLLNIPVPYKNTNLRMGIGAGYDLIETNQLTITPSISYMYSPGIEFYSLPYSDRNNTNTSNLHQLQFQLRIGISLTHAKSENPKL